MHPEVQRRLNKYKNKLENVLDLSGLSLKDIPLEVFELTDMKVLDLSQNSICFIPKEIEQLSQLKSLTLSGNYFSKLPTLPESLRQLSLNNCSLEEIPSVIGQSKLTYLCLAHNEIDQLPKSFFNCTTLKNLDLSYNKIIEIPKEVERLVALEYLNTIENAIQRFPISISNLENLRKLRAEGNFLEAFPNVNPKKVILKEPHEFNRNGTRKTYQDLIDSWKHQKWGW